LGHIKLLGGFGKAAQSGNRFENADLGQGAVFEVAADLVSGHDGPLVQAIINRSALKKPTLNDLHLERTGFLVEKKGNYILDSLTAWIYALRDRSNGVDSHAQ
jgi:hypothetical protein